MTSLSRRQESESAYGSVLWPTYPPPSTADHELPVPRPLLLMIGRWEAWCFSKAIEPSAAFGRIERSTFCVVVQPARSTIAADEAAVMTAIIDLRLFFILYVYMRVGHLQRPFCAVQLFWDVRGCMNRQVCPACRFALDLFEDVRYKWLRTSG